MPRRGDFEVDRWDVFAARNTHEDRSERAQGVDAERRAPVTTDVEYWREQPGRLDYPGLDTPRPDPHVLPKDLQQRQVPDVEPPVDGVVSADPLGATERETVAFEARAREMEGLSMSPEEAVEGVGSVSHTTSLGGRMERWGGLAAEEEADMAFAEAESERTMDEFEEVERELLRE